MEYDAHVAPALHALRRGGLLLFPTDTIWGIGCDATNAAAVRDIYTLKDRPLDKPCVLLVDSLTMLQRYVGEVHPRIETLLLHHLRPLTIIYEQAQHLPPIAKAQDGSVAIRVVQDRFCRRLINLFDRPIVGTSANVSSQPFPTRFGEIRSDIIQGCDHVVRYRQTERDLDQPSVIARLPDPTRPELEFLRS